MLVFFKESKPLHPVVETLLSYKVIFNPSKARGLKYSRNFGNANGKQENFVICRRLLSIINSGDLSKLSSTNLSDKFIGKKQSAIRSEGYVKEGSKLSLSIQNLEQRLRLLDSNSLETFKQLSAASGL